MPVVAPITVLASVAPFAVLASVAPFAVLASVTPLAAPVTARPIAVPAGVAPFATSVTAGPIATLAGVAPFAARPIAARLVAAPPILAPAAAVPIARPASAPVTAQVVAAAVPAAASTGATVVTVAVTLAADSVARALAGLTTRGASAAAARTVRRTRAAAWTPSTRTTPPAARGAAARPTSSRPPAVARPAPALLLQPQAQPDPVTRHVDAEDLDLDHVAGLDHVPRIRDVLGRHRRHVHQPVLVHAHVYECTERGHVGNHALEDHSGLEVGNLLDALRERRRAELRPRVSPRLLQLGQDVGHGRQTEEVVYEVRRLQRAQHRPVAQQGPHVLAGRRDDPAYHRIGLGMHRRRVQRVVSAHP